MNKGKVAVIMGSDSDFSVVKRALTKLKDFEIEYDCFIMSAHRTPEMASNFAKDAKDNNYKVIIAAAGKAAHLAGVLAAHTTLPVIGIPIESSLNGLDALLSTVQMPPSIPVATVSINGAENAAILAAQILAVHDVDLDKKIVKFKEDLKESVACKNQKLQDELKNI